MQDADRKLAWSAVIVLGVLALEMAWNLFIGPTDYRPSYATQCENNCSLPWWDSAAAWTMIFTGLLTGSTVLLWFSTRRSAGIAERALTELERPFIYVRFTDPGVTIVPSLMVGSTINYGKLTSEIFNLGRSPANLTRISLEVTAVLRGQEPPKIDPSISGGLELPRGIVSEKDTPWQHSVNLFHHSIVKQDDSGVLHRKVSIWAIGFVRYADIFGSNYITGFAYVFDVIGNGWVMRGDASYNYGRSEKPAEIPEPSSRG